MNIVPCPQWKWALFITGVTQAMMQGMCSLTAWVYSLQWTLFLSSMNFGHSLAAWVLMISLQWALFHAKHRLGLYSLLVSPKLWCKECVHRKTGCIHFSEHRSCLVWTRAIVLFHIILWLVLFHYWYFFHLYTLNTFTYILLIIIIFTFWL